MNLTVVLHRPQDVVNIAVIIRAMQNFGVSRLRLVNPVEFVPYRIEGIAHKSADLIRQTTIFDDLDAALADCAHVVGMTARGRTVKRNMQLPRDAGPDIRARAEAERVAILLGPEDKGLTNDDLDRCHRVVTIPTAPDNPSLNLAQAATLILYEIFQAGSSHSFKTPRRTAPAAGREVLEGLFGDIEAALEAIEFFKSHTNTAIMRTVRELIHRADVDEREAGLMRAMSREVVNYLERKGIETS
jgi:TrmH family RNA methyltransferase